ncbi:MAG: histidinol-phosphate transaminase [Candidatus Binatus sp.]|uniref:histidinol-phosphate transaminase n=1 Tax=Candidatus Binatus sp. TaxID=2811406 RepID=UPI0027205B3D|nr:histidinol-phosphate transaminase [Candidatus Binatus sp.]MDO8433897.1 histidinol-phosphate transaminase [Candidatus Binatus sp.]
MTRGVESRKVERWMFRESIKKMAAYVPGEQPRPGQRVIKLNTNENPYPPSPRVRRAVAAAVSGTALRLYPAPRADEFVASAARLYSIPQKMIIAGNGSDELLAMIFRATLGAGDTVAYAVPTYSLYDTLALVQEARILHFPLGADFELPLEAIAQARAKLTIVCNPNSPSGTLTPARKIAALAKQLDDRLLVIDEAYVDFAEENALPLLKRHRNLVILRTLSKSYSLAGMRLGLCFAHPRAINALMKVKDSYNLSRVALAAGAEALKDSAWMRKNVEKVKRTRSVTEAALRKLGFVVTPSQANFVLARMPGKNMAPVTRGLRRAGILVRHFPTPLLRDALRISIGTPAEMKALFAALEPLIKQSTAKRRSPA